MAGIESAEKDRDVVEEPTPVWVKVFAIVGIILFLAFIGLHITGKSPGGNHMRHAPSTENSR